MTTPASLMDSPVGCEKRQIEHQKDRPSIDKSTASVEEKSNNEYADHELGGEHAQAQNAEQVSPVTFPDGGLQAWATVMGAYVTISSCGPG